MSTEAQALLFWASAMRSAGYENSYARSCAAAWARHIIGAGC